MDWLEQLQQVKSKLSFEDNHSNKLNIMGTLEDINPDMAKNSKSLKDSNKYIFKQYLNYKTAEEIINLVTELKSKNEHEVREYKRKLHNICALAVNRGESPVEMLIYATKGIDENQMVLNVIKDELKELYVYDSNLPQAYSNILKNWNWNDQIRIVLNNIVDINLGGMEDILIEIFEKNSSLREEVAGVIIDLKYEKYFTNIINLFLSVKDDTNEVYSMIVRVFTKISKASDYGASCLLKAYFEFNGNRQLSNIMIAGIKKNMSSEVLETLRKRSLSSDYQTQRRALNLLAKSNYFKAKDILKELVNDPRVDQARLATAMSMSVDGEEINYYKSIVEDYKKPINERTRAIISIGNIENKENILFIEKFVNISPEFEIACISALVQLGQNAKITNLFKYILTRDISADYKDLAMHQIKRLWGVRDKELHNNLLLIASKLLQQESVVLTVLEIFIGVRADSEIVKVILEKLNNTKIEQAKLMILDYLTKNYSIGDSELSSEIRAAIVVCSTEEKNLKIKQKAMECLNKITKNDTFAPISN